MEIKNKTVLIMGGDSDFATILATEFSKQNNKVVLFGRCADTLVQATKQIKNCHCILNEVSGREDLNHLYAYFAAASQPIDLIINNADGLTENEQPVVFESSLAQVDNISLISLLHLTEFFVPILAKQNQAAIVNLLPICASKKNYLLPPFIFLKHPHKTYAKTLKLIVSNTSVKTLDVFIQNKIASDKISQNIIKCLRNNKSTLHI
jgi:uncharacterized oxidoreductase